MPNPSHQESDLQSSVLDSPLGPIYLTATAGRLCSLSIGDSASSGGFAAPSELSLASPSTLTSGEVLALTEQQLREYFAGTRKVFDIPLSLGGTAFQKSIWAQLAAIPFGVTSSYGELARAVGSPQAARAVGGAVGANPIPIVVGCHRILSSNRTLTGYSGGRGLETKQWLLQHEAIEWRN